MIIKEKVSFVKRTDSYHIIDDEINVSWFIQVSYENNVIVGMIEAINPYFFRQQGADYIDKVLN